MSTSSAQDFGIQSYCFRHFTDNATVAGMVRELGLSKIEVCAVHADFNDLAGWKDIVNVYAAQGVDIVSIGVQGFSGAIDKERTWFECAAAAGAKYISAHFAVDTFQQAIPAAASLCEEYGIRIAIHCHGGYMFGGQPDVLAHLMELGGPNIGLCLDTAWCMQIGPHQGNPIRWAERFQDRLYGIHYKDFTFNADGSWNDVVVGTGTLDLPAFAKTVVNGGFEGYAVIEYEADAQAPMPALKSCVASMRKAMS